MTTTFFTTGSEALDRVLGGGIPAASTTMVAGMPGTGKTILAEQFLFANASAQAPALYLTTLSEPLEKVVRYLQSFAFFDPGKLPGVIHYRDVGENVRNHGIRVLPEEVEALLDQTGAAFVVIDSVKALHDLSPDPVAFRIALFDLGRVLTAAGATALLVGEYESGEIARLPEFAVADGVLELRNQAHGVRDERTVRVHKLRGAATLPGEHSFRITSHGLEVFPRLTGQEDQDAGAQTTRQPTGIPGLDPLLDGGLWRGTATLVAGPSGVGKTLLGIGYLLGGHASGERGVLVSFQESPQHLRRTLDVFGVSQAPGEMPFVTLHVSPLELDLVQLFGQIRTAVEQVGARRLVIDAIGDMQEAAIERDRFRAAIWTLMRYLTASGVTGLFMSETPLASGDGLTAVTRAEISYMADNVILLRYVRPPVHDFDRALEVLKTRGSAHDPYAHPYRIGPRGIDVLAERLGDA